MSSGNGGFQRDGASDGRRRAAVWLYVAATFGLMAILSLPGTRFVPLLRKLVPVVRVPGFQSTIGPPFQWFPPQLPTTRLAIALPGLSPASRAPTEGGRRSIRADSGLEIPHPGSPIPPGTGNGKPGGGGPGKGGGNGTPAWMLRAKQRIENHGGGQGKHRFARLVRRHQERKEQGHQSGDHKKHDSDKDKKKKKRRGHH